MTLRDIFETVCSFFESEEMDYAVIGAFALYGFGYVRATRDVDFVTKSGYQTRIVAFLESLGFDTIHSSEAFSNHVHPIGSGRVDMMYVEGATADQIFSQVRPISIFKSRTYPVVSPLHLVAMKLFSASNDPERKLKDLADIEQIIKTTAIDLTELKKLFTKYGLEDWYDELSK
jgi:hypothetical protein